MKSQRPLRPGEIVSGLYIIGPHKAFAQRLFAQLAKDALAARKTLNQLISIAKKPQLALLAEQTNNLHLARLIQLADTESLYVLDQFAALARCEEIIELEKRTKNEVLASLIACALDYDNQIIKIAIVRSSNDFNPNSDTDESKAFIPANRYYALPERSSNWNDLSQEKYLGNVYLRDVLFFIEESLSKGLKVYLQEEWFNGVAAASCVAFLMKTKDYDKEGAIKLIAERTGLICNFSYEQNQELSRIQQEQHVSVTKRRINELTLAGNSLDAILQSNSEISYPFVRNVTKMINEINQELTRLGKSLSQAQSIPVIDNTLRGNSIFKAENISPIKAITMQNTNIQLGWNCFDLAANLGDRNKFVDFALSHAEDLSYRELLAPEIILAANLPSTESTALPASMRTQEVQGFVENYQNAHEQMKPAVAKCNDQLKYKEGKRLSLEQLITFFENEENITKHNLALTELADAYQTIFMPAVNAFYAYATRQDIYRQYIKEYYGVDKTGKGGWFVCHNSFTNEKQTSSMIDIAAIYLQAKITVYLVDEKVNEKLHETAAQENGREIEINWRGKNGNGHFVARQKELADNKENRHNLVR